MSKTVRLLTAVAALLLGVLYVTPLWRIDLSAPQYPEGLGMVIHIDTLTGVKPNDIENINGLNHYIGMKEIEVDEIPVLRIMPWVLGGLIATGVVVAIAGRAGLLYGWVGMFAAAGLAGLVEFWRWEYEYGHDLDMEHAIITIPGMSYQPPLFGSKQIANFVATSFPDVGGWTAGVAFLIAAVAVVVTVRQRRAAHARAESPAGDLRPARA